MNLKEFAEKYGNKKVEEAKLKDLLGIKDSKVWKPRHNETYWYTNSVDKIYQEYWGNTHEDSYRYSVGNCHKTKEEAIFARNKQVFMTKLKRDFEENSEEIDWSDSTQCKYNIYINGHCIGSNFQGGAVGFGTPVTTNKEWLKNYIKENEADIRKYYFGKGKQNERN